MTARALRLALLFALVALLPGCPPSQPRHAIVCPRHLVAVLP